MNVFWCSEKIIDWSICRFGIFLGDPRTPLLSVLISPLIVFELVLFLATYPIRRLLNLVEGTQS